ncbi:hypothetical protein RSP03_02770 [Cereibacter sphaeroides]|nr:hypothetical protein RSP03_02770 [Cereibacter sphaeroides]
MGGAIPRGQPGDHLGREVRDGHRALARDPRPVSLQAIVHHQLRRAGLAAPTAKIRAIGISQGPQKRRDTSPGNCRLTVIQGGTHVKEN